MELPPQEPSHPDSEFLRKLAAAQAGDHETLAALVDAYYPRVEAMVHRSMRHSIRAKRPWLSSRFSTGDIVQEVFRSLLKDLNAFKAESEEDFVAYMATLVRNRLVDAIRFHEASLRDGRRTDPVSEWMNRQVLDPGPATQAAMADELRAFNRTMETFPLREQLILRGRIVQGLNFQELADLQGYPSKYAARRAFYRAQALFLIRTQQSDMPQASHESRPTQ